MRAGDVLLGLASSGVHSNGFSLVRKVVEKSGPAWDAPAPFDRQQTLGEALLTPTRIYVKSCLAAIRETKAVKALAHITGGGFPDNIPRVLPDGLGVAHRSRRACRCCRCSSGWRATGGVAEAEMLRTFNCGIGMIVVVEPRQGRRGRRRAEARGRDAWCGSARWSRAGGEPRVSYTGRLDI